jgi:hypothetical protein
MLGFLVPAIILAMGGRPLVSEMMQALKQLPLFTFLGALAALFISHELVHAVCYPGSLFSRNCVIGFMPGAGTAYAWYGGEMTRRRYIVVVLAPTIVLSVVPLLAYAMVPGATPVLVPFAIVNLVGCGMDWLCCYYVLRGVPASAYLQYAKNSAYWGRPSNLLQALPE